MTLTSELGDENITLHEVAVVQTCMKFQEIISRESKSYGWGKQSHSITFDLGFVTLILKLYGTLSIDDAHAYEALLSYLEQIWAGQEKGDGCLHLCVP